MKEFNEDISVISDNGKKLARSEMKLLKLQLVKEISTITSFVFSRFILSILLFVTYAILFTGFGIYLNSILDSTWLGLVVTGLLSLFIVCLTFIFRKLVIEHPFQDYIITQMAKKIKL